MTALAQARAEQARLGEFLRTHAAWRDSDELVDVPGHGRMRARTAYAGALAGPFFSRERAEEHRQARLYEIRKGFDCVLL